MFLCIVICPQVELNSMRGDEGSHSTGSCRDRVINYSTEGFREAVPHKSLLLASHVWRRKATFDSQHVFPYIDDRRDPKISAQLHRLP